MTDAATMSPLEWERHIETRVAREMNAIDRIYLRGEMTERAYLAEIARLDDWADAEIANGPHP